MIIWGLVSGLRGVHPHAEPLASRAKYSFSENMNCLLYLFLNYPQIPTII